MDDFALVAEGVTDHAILEAILQGYFEEQRPPIINRDFPSSTDVDRYGGWTLVLKYLRDKKYKAALQLNRFIVIQIDSDVSEEPGFGVPKQDENGRLSPEQLALKIIDRLCEIIGPEDLTTYAGKFIFAIGVEQLECWVLPLWYQDNKAKKTANCTVNLGQCAQLRDALDRKNLPWIRPEEKNFYSYELAVRDYLKSTILLRRGPKNPSLKLFLDHLASKAIILTPIDED